MKWLLIGACVLVGVVLITAAGLWLAGRRQDAGVNSLEIEVRAPPAVVWTYLKDEQRVKQWVGGLTEITPVEGSGFAVGAKVKMVMMMDGQRHEALSEITEIVEERRFAQRVTAAPGAAVQLTELATFTLEPSERGTRLHMHARTEYHGGLVRLLEPLITRAAQRKLTQDLERLRALVESDRQSAARG